MNLLDSLLDAIVRLDGDALVMHVGEKPYVVTTSEATNEFRGPLAWGQVELSSRVLTSEAVVGMLGQILPIDQRVALDEYGATDYEVAAVTDPAERFTIVAARGGDDIWLEVRRLAKQKHDALAIPAAEPEPQIAAVAAVAAVEPEPVDRSVDEPALAVVEESAVEDSVVEEPLIEEHVAEQAVEGEVNEQAEPAFELQPPAVEEPQLPDVVAEHQQPTVDRLVAHHAPSQAIPSELEPDAVRATDNLELPIYDDVTLVDEDAVPQDEHVSLAEELEEIPVSAAGDETLTAVIAAHEQAIAAGRAAFDSVDDVIAAHRDWTDDVMTEGDLGELLRASAAAIILGETGANAPEPRSTESVGDRQVDEPALAAAEDLHEAVSFQEPEVIDISDEEEPAFVLVDDDAPEESFVAEARERFEEPEPVLVGVEHTAASSAAALTPAQQAVQAAREALMAAQGITLPGAGVPAADAQTEHEEPARSAGQEISTVAFDHSVPPAQPEHSQIAHSETRESRPSLVEEFRPSGTHELEPVASEEVPQPVSQLFAPMASDSLDAPAHEPKVVSGEGAGSDHRDEDDAPSFRQPAVVLPLVRQVRGDGSPEIKGSVAATLQRLLRLAATRGAGTVYIVAQSAPMVRVDGEFSVLDGEPVLNPAFVERLLAELTPRTRDAAAGPAAEWIADVPEIGRVRCVTFRDHRGPGIIFRMVPPRAISADQLALSAEVQALCTEADGLVLIAGGRGSGRSTLLSSFVDLVNRTRSDYVITTESQIEFVHENRRSFISQREIRGNGEALATAVRAACREEPDVLIIEDMRTPELVALALEAAESGRLVFGAVPAVSTVSAVERVIEMFPVDRREKAQASLAGALRGIVSQVLLRKLKGGRVAAREVLINTPAVANLIAEGKTFELHAALDSGRRHGMMPFSESLAALVREGAVHPSHAYRKAPDREHFLAVLRRDGMDASISERLA